MTEPSIGFVGLGRLGSVLASNLLEAGHPVLCCSRGRSREVIARGAELAGDGSARAVAERAEVVFTCLPGGSLDTAFGGADGILAAAPPLPIVIELSTAEIAEKAALREQMAEGGGELLDCPISGTPEMAAARASVIYASGDRPTYDKVADLLLEISPKTSYVGPVGAGTKLKYVANLLALVHVSAAAEAMALAKDLGLDLDDVAALLSQSPAASSGQFTVRAPMIAAGRFEGKLVTIRDARENLDQITAAAERVGTSVPLASTAKALFDEFGASGEDESDPCKLALFLGSEREEVPS